MGVVVIQEGKEWAAVVLPPCEPSQERPVHRRGVLRMLPRARDQVKPTAEAFLQEPVQDEGPGRDFDPVAQGDVAVEGVVDVDREILVVRETPSQAGLAAAIVEIGRESRGVISM